jgi:hypothetical protein
MLAQNLEYVDFKAFRRKEIRPSNRYLHKWEYCDAPTKIYPCFAFTDLIHIFDCKLLTTVHQI